MLHLIASLTLYTLSASPSAATPTAVSAEWTARLSVAARDVEDLAVAPLGGSLINGSAYYDGKGGLMELLLDTDSYRVEPLGVTRTGAMVAKLERFSTSDDVVAGPTQLALVSVTALTAPRGAIAWPRHIRNVAVRDDGRALATLGNHEVVVRNLPDFTELWRQRLPPRVSEWLQTHQLAWRDDATVVVSGQLSVVVVKSGSTDDTMTLPFGPADPGARDLALDPAGKVVAHLVDDGSVAVRSIPGGEVLAQARVPGDFEAVAVSSAHRRLVIATTTGLHIMRWKRGRVLSDGFRPPTSRSKAGWDFAPRLVVTLDDEIVVLTHQLEVLTRARTR